MPITFEDDPQDVKVSQEQLRKQLGATKKATEVVGSGLNAGEDLGISASNWQDTFRNWISPVTRGFARAGGEAAGSTLGGPAGFAAGGIAADQLYTQILGRLSPRTFGGPSSNPFADLKTSALETGADAALVRGIPIIKDALKTKALHKFFKPDPNLPIREAVETLPEGFNPTIAQATGNKNANWFENIVVSEGKRDATVQAQQMALKRQADIIADDITQRSWRSSKLDLAARTREELKKSYEVVHEERKRLYDTAENLISKEKQQGFRVDYEPATIDKATGNVIPGKRKIIPTDITGPVRLNNTMSFAKKLSDETVSYLDNPNAPAYQMPGVKDSLIAFKNKLSTFLGGNLLVADANDFKPVMEYATAIKDKQELDHLFKSLPYNLQKQFAETMRGLRNTITKDIKESSLTWDPATKRALDSANEYHVQTYIRKFGRDFVKKFAKVEKFSEDPNVNEEEMFDMALNNATLARNVVQANGTPKYLAGEYIKRFINEMQDVNGVMMGGRGIDYLEKTKEIAQQFLTSDQRHALTNFARQVQVASWPEGGIPRTSMAFRGAYMGLSIGSGILTGSLTGNAGAGILGVALIPYARNKFGDMMLNQANVRIAARLSRLPAGSPEATSLMKTLFKGALKGARFDIQSATGTALGLFEARSDGKLHPVDPVSMPEDQKLSVKFED